MAKKPVYILGIETSCDETGISLIAGFSGEVMNCKVVAEQLSSQIQLHQQWGGVVPEIASRDHVRRCIQLVDQTLLDAGVDKQQIDLIAYTAGPGLMGALFVGACVARGLAFALQKPFVAIHHMEAHLLVPMLESSHIKPPFAALLVSGGHSQFYGVQTIGDYSLVGETLDDAAGEAFDKVAKILGLNYPGGPAISALAEHGQVKYALPRPMCDRPGFDLSFSGLKTATLQLVRRLEADQCLEQEKANVAASFQEAVVDTLCRKADRVLKHLGLTQLVVAGGVSANVRLRQKLGELAEKKGYNFFYPPLAWCTDNGVMIAYAGWHKWQRQQISHQHSSGLEVRARWPLDSCSN